MTKKQQFHIKAHFILSMLIAFLLPLAHFVPIIIILIILNWLIEGDFRNKFHRIMSARFAVLFCLFYILHLFGLIYTENMHAGTFDVQVKLSLIIFPLLYASRPLKQENMLSIFMALLGGGLLCSLLLIINASITYLTSGVNNFFYESFTAHVIHPSYLAMYLNVIICWLLIQLQKNVAVFKRFSTPVSLLLVLYFSCVLVLLSSKLGLLTLAFIYVATFIYYSRKRYMVGILGIVVSLLMAWGIIRFIPAITDRVKTATDALTATTTNNADAESTAVRMLIWKAANEVISEHLILGTGPGDAKDELMKEYEKRGMTGALEHHLNAHNEFYQVFVALGLIGFLVFCMQLFFPLALAVKEKNNQYAFFLIIIILNFLTEAMLEAEAGVIFYAFFNSILCFTTYSKPQNNHSHDTVLATAYRSEDN